MVVLCEYLVLSLKSDFTYFFDGYCKTLYIYYLFLAGLWVIELFPSFVYFRDFLNSNLHDSKEEEDEPVTELDIDFSVTNLDY